MRIGNNPIDRNEEELTPNFNPQFTAMEPPSNPNSDNLVVTHGKAPPPLNSTIYNAPSEHLSPVNSLANLIANFELPPRLKLKTDLQPHLIQTHHRINLMRAKLLGRPGTPPTIGSCAISRTIRPPTRGPHAQPTSGNLTAAVSSRLRSISSGAQGTTQGPRSYAVVVNNRQTISQAEKSKRKSFAIILHAPHECRDFNLVSKEPNIHHGKPAFFFSYESEEQFLAEAYGFTLAGKFICRKPLMIKVHENFLQFGFIGDYELDFLKVYTLLSI
ncbi:Hypothetical predicted protein [Olea europaea subsp. europaea]|uniref:Uncharacterized protein n=1 Tax=Olea europaea subsp. europaea TaxID=158383 RepID=A0A8S0UME6_OLEEU|nr:Hypothetical predicted protein [Olea europaea subsp. europaea]